MRFCPGCHAMAGLWQSRSNRARKVRGTTTCKMSGSKGCVRFSTPWWSSKNAESLDSDCLSNTVWQKSSTRCSSAISSIVRGASRSSCGGAIWGLDAPTSVSSTRSISVASNYSVSSHSVWDPYKAGASSSPLGSSRAGARVLFRVSVCFRVVTSTWTVLWSHFEEQTWSTSSSETSRTVISASEVGIS